MSTIKPIIEALLMVSDTPLSVNKLLKILSAKMADDPLQQTDVESALQSLAEDYHERGVELAKTASGYRFQTRVDYRDWIDALFDERPRRYSRALMETLAIIAYKQPITRGEIEGIRGVGVSSMIIRSLQDREWIKVAGYKEVVGHPTLFKTTPQFLDYFNLNKLTDLPPVRDIQQLDKLPADLFSVLKDQANQANQDQADQQETDPLTNTQDQADQDQADQQETDPIINTQDQADQDQADQQDQANQDQADQDQADQQETDPLTNTQDQADQQETDPLTNTQDQPQLS